MLSSYEEFIEGYNKKEVIDYNNPTCNNPACSECCTMSVALTTKEYKRLERYLTKDVNGQVLYKKAINMIKENLNNNIIYFKCPFISNNKCSINRFKPQVCKDFHCKPELNKINMEMTEEEINSIYSYTILNLFFK